MDAFEFGRVKDGLIQAAVSIVKNGPEQVAIAKALNKIDEDAESHEMAILGMIQVLYDGVSYGNWPWSRP